MENCKSVSLINLNTIYFYAYVLFNIVENFRNNILVLHEKHVNFCAMFKLIATLFFVLITVMNDSI